jgi:beta-lactam-binding protein with PASTA domain
MNEHKVSPETVVVPNLVGLPLDVAGRVLRSLLWEASAPGSPRDEYRIPDSLLDEEFTSRESKKIPIPQKGRELLRLVSTQSPAAGTTVSAGSSVAFEYETIEALIKPRNPLKVFVIILATLAILLTGTAVTVSIAQRPASVPNLIGLTEEQALDAIASARLTPVDEIQRVVSKEPVGSVAGQSPSAGTKTTAGYLVNFSVSGGSQLNNVPDLIGQQEANVAARITAAGLTVGAVRETPSLQPRGTVVQQTPIAGSTVFSGDRVSVFVSSGYAKMPSVVGLSETKALDKLQKVGLTAQIRLVPGQKGIVVSQLPATGQQVPTSMSVFLLVGDGPIPTASPTPQPTKTVTISPTPTLSPSQTKTPSASPTPTN